MIGIVLITHQHLGSALESCLKHILGTVPTQWGVLELEQNTCPTEFLDRTQDLIYKVDSGAGVLILTDIYGASPSNLATLFINRPQIEIITGVNLPMLLRAVTYRALPMDALIDKLLSGGRASIFQVERTPHADPTG